MATEFEPTLFVFDELDWVDERREPGAAAKLIEEAERTGARRDRGPIDRPVVPRNALVRPELLGPLSTAPR